MLRVPPVWLVWFGLVGRCVLSISLFSSVILHYLNTPVQGSNQNKLRTSRKQSKQAENIDLVSCQYHISSYRNSITPLHITSYAIIVHCCSAPVVSVPVVSSFLFPVIGPGLGSGWLLLVACFVLVMVSEVQNTHVKSSQGSQANHGSRCQVQQYLPLSHCTPHVRAQTSLCGMSWHWHWWWLCSILLSSSMKHNAS
jgi:hypothetical protein